MGWFTRQYGLEASQRVARGEGVDVVSGRSLAQNEADWLRWLDQKNIQPKPCEEAIPQDHIFRLVCRKLAE
jgi:hypothetical protein